MDEVYLVRQPMLKLDHVVFQFMTSGVRSWSSEPSTSTGNNFSVILIALPVIVLTRFFYRALWWSTVGFEDHPHRTYVDWSNSSYYQARVISQPSLVWSSSHLCHILYEGEHLCQVLLCECLYTYCNPSAAGHNFVTVIPPMMISFFTAYQYGSGKLARRLEQRYDSLGCYSLVMNCLGCPSCVFCLGWSLRHLTSPHSDWHWNSLGVQHSTKVVFKWMWMETDISKYASDWNNMFRN